MSTLFSLVDTPPLLSLLSSSTFPHPSWSSTTDTLLPDDSFIVHFPSDSSPDPSTPLPPSAALVHTSAPPKGAIAHPVIHLQSPNVKSTYVRCPPKGSKVELGLASEWVHLQLRTLGRRELVIELGVRDGRGTRGVVRCSTFTTTSHLSASTLSPGHPTTPPILLLPINLPPKTSSTLTPWMTVSLSLASLLGQFATLAQTAPLPAGSAPMPTSQTRGAVWTYIKVYANCRLRRVWASQEQGSEGGGRGREELGVWGVEDDE